MKKHLILLLAVAAVLTAMLSCGQGQQSAEKQSEADSLLVAVWNAGDYERVIVIISVMAAVAIKNFFILLVLQFIFMYWFIILSVPDRNEKAVGLKRRSRILRLVAARQRYGKHCRYGQQ